MATDRLLIMPNKLTFPAVIEVMVEIPAGSRNKYEYDEDAATEE